MAKRRKKSRRSALAADLGDLTKKDFVGIAGILCKHDASPALTKAFAGYFKEENPRFDEGRFVAAVKSCKAGR